jgi:hypothetical protein
MKQCKQSELLVLQQLKWKMTWFSCIAGYSVLIYIQFVSCLKLHEYTDDTEGYLYIQMLHLGTFVTFEILLEISEDNSFVAQI